VVVKSGRSAAGARAAASHTGALLATSDITVDALFRQSGIIRTDTLEEMFDVATLLAHQPPPPGDRVAIITNAGGLAILCADTCEANDLRVTPLSDETQARLREFPARGGCRQSRRYLSPRQRPRYQRAIWTVGEDPGVDAIIASSAGGAARLDRHAPRGSMTPYCPVITTFMSARGLPADLQEAGTRIPSYAFPEQAAIALAHAAEYGRWRAKPAGQEPHFADTKPDEAASVIAAGLSRGGGWLADDEVEHLLNCYGIPLVRAERATTPEEAGAAADRIGRPVALKAFGPQIVHKTIRRLGFA
jgi:acyl-CoA synthetase (NDP forming)